MISSLPSTCRVSTSISECKKSIAKKRLMSPALSARFGVADVHFHPAQPRSFRVSMSYRF
jgi:hypothetical protein